MELPPPPRSDPDRGLLDDLFARPPVSRAELDGRLEAARAPRIRDLLLERLQADTISDQEGGILLAVFERIGVGESRPALLRLVLDAGQPLRVRARALSVLLEDDPHSLEQLVGKLPEQELQPLAAQWLSELLGAIQADPRQGEVLAETMEAASVTLRPFLLDQVETVRRSAGTSAAGTYGRALHRPDLADLHGRMLALIVEEARPESIALLEELWRKEPPGSRRRQLHGAVFRARTKRIEPQPTEAPSGAAYLGSCDGQGVYILVGCFRNLDGTETIADLCVRVGADVRDGFVLPRRRPDEAQRLLDEITRDTGIAFAPLSLADAAALVREAAECTAGLGLSLPSDARPAMQLFERVEPGAALIPRENAGRAPVEAGAPGSPATGLDELRDLLGRPEYTQSWFFDRGDLQAAGLELPGGTTDLAAWAREIAPRLDRPSLRARLRGMAEHMARWHRWKGETELADLCSAAARATEQDFARSPLVLAMLECSVVPAEDQPDSGGESQLDRLLLRQHLKSLFFQHVQSPRGRDLARLDFTEAALVFLEEAFLGLPGERRPRQDERATTAYTIGKAFADFLIAGAHGSIERVIADMDRALRDYCHLDETECRRVVAVVLPALGDFIEQHCAECPAACLDRPGADVSEFFFAPCHPGGRGKKPGGGQEGE
jgi:hypothetical protein